MTKVYELNFSGMMAEPESPVKYISVSNAQNTHRDSTGPQWHSQIDQTVCSYLCAYRFT